MAKLWKVIKPAALKVDAMRLELLNSLRKVGTGVRHDFEATTATWEHKPKFETKVSLAGGKATLTVDTDDEIYGYVSKGTRPHIIRPKRAKALHFFGTYTAKTVPGVIGSGGGGSGGDEVFSRHVNHPGTAPRNFDKIIAAKWRKHFKNRMQATMRDVAQASGHAMR